MTNALLKLEVFETAPLEDTDARLDVHQAVKLRENAFEEGYAAGWQDALEHMRNEDALRRIAVEEALQQISFSYAEAHQALSVAFLGLTGALLSKVMPQVTEMALPERVATELADLVAQQTKFAVIIACSPAVRPMLEPLQQARPDLQITFHAEPCFSDAQVALRMDAQEREINFDALLEALRTVFEQQSQTDTTPEQAHG